METSAAAREVLLTAFRAMEQRYEWPVEDPKDCGYYAPSISEVADVAVAALREAGLLTGG